MQITDHLQIPWLASELRTTCVLRIVCCSTSPSSHSSGGVNYRQPFVSRPVLPPPSMPGRVYKENFSEIMSDAVVFRPEIPRSLTSRISTFLHSSFSSPPLISLLSSSRVVSHVSWLHHVAVVVLNRDPLMVSQSGREETIINTTNQDAAAAAVEVLTNEECVRVLKYKSFPFIAFSSSVIDILAIYPRQR